MKGKANTDAGMHFKCIKCGNLRDRKRELSQVSKTLLATPRAKGLKQKELDSYLMCKFCQAIPASMPPALVSFFANRRYWEQRVTEKEVTSPEPIAPVKTDQMVTVDKIAGEFDISPSTIHGWIRKGELTPLKDGDGPATFRLSEVLKVVEAHLDNFGGKNDGPRSRADHIGHHLFLTRQRLGLTQREVAQQVGVHRATIQHIERLHVTYKGTLLLVQAWLLAHAEIPDNVTPIVRHPHKVEAPAPWEKSKLDELTDEIAGLRTEIRRLQSYQQHVQEWFTRWAHEAPGWHGWDELQSWKGE